MNDKMEKNYNLSLFDGNKKKNVIFNKCITLQFST